ncbi:MAG: hypothetical protein WAU45_15405 [Blastocatellia bacterium]
MARKGCYRVVLGAILLAGWSLVGAPQAESGSKDREQKKRVELMVVEKKQSERPARNNETRGQRPSQRRR